MIEGISSQLYSTGLQGDDEDAANSGLKRTCAEFESIFIHHMLKSMRKAVNEAGVLGESNESKIITSMFDENLAFVIAKAGGIGLGEALYQHLKD